jgi:hypothetical protein
MYNGCLFEFLKNENQYESKFLTYSVTEVTSFPRSIKEILASTTSSSAVNHYFWMGWVREPNLEGQKVKNEITDCIDV